MTLEFTLDPELTPELRAEIITLWTEVTNAGGAVGFVAPVTEDEVRVTAEQQFAGLVPDGPDHLLIAHAADGQLAALLVFVSMRFGLMEHWRTVMRVMVDPKLQGQGYGAQLLAEAERIARDWGLAGLQLHVRGGHGLENFYERSGYVEAGRIPGALRVAPGDDRDSVTMWLELR